MRGMTTLRLAAALALMGCGGPAPEPEAPPIERVEESGGMSALGDGAEAPALPQRRIGHAEDHPDVSHLLATRSAAAPPADTHELYQRLAPSTVIVRSQHSMGTGVVVGPGGLILTNNHVIDGAALEDFRMRVTVEYGQIGDTGSMVPDGRQRTAYILKRDPNRDLAILRVEEPEADAPVVALAAEDPTPGDHVTTVGHGNVGMVWAVRGCEVEATGRMEETYARLAAICGSEEQLSQMMCRQLRERMHSQMAGVVIQSSCVLAPGDSGGPLVNPQGLLVGLNVMTVRNERGQWSNFHIHGRELRDFLSSVPEAPQVQLPTPWLASPVASAVRDEDLDGEWDTVMLMGSGRERIRLHDLDQDSAPFSVSDVGAVIAERRFDAEMAIVSRNDESFVWYDSDGDGDLELLLTLDARHRVTAAHRVDGEAIASVPVPGGEAISAARVPPAGRERFERLFGESHRGDQPSPLPALLREARPVDSDGDGAVDALQGDRVFVHVLTFDVDQDSTAGLAPDGVEAFVRDGRLDAEVSLVRRGPILWGFYDRDGDGRMDTGLRTAPVTPVVADVAPVAGVEPTLTREQVLGTIIIRADWVGERERAFDRMLHRHVGAIWMVDSNDHGGLPDPLRHHDHPRVRASYTERGWENAVLSIESEGFSTTAIDVDRDSFRGRGRAHAADLAAAVQGGHFSAELAVASMRNATWAWYDTDLDGTWDLVLVRVDDMDGPRTNAFRRGEDGAFAPDPALASGRLVRPSLFPRRHRRRLQQAAAAIFAASEIED